ncbi:MAG: multicopper oxidase domain-containing protein [Xanthobacteraceae bacterium]|nr:multicopper oxidase domain-containing protein [Xanthobacteraceae bacterium]
MNDQRFSPPRRTILKALGGLAATPVLDGFIPVFAASSEQKPLAVRLEPRSLALSQGAPPTPVWSVEDGSSSLASLIRGSGDAAVQLANASPIPAGFEVRGLEGGVRMPQSAIQPGAVATLELTDQSGTFLIDPRLLSDGAEKPTQPRVLVVEGGETFNADRDEVLLIEDWKIGTDGKAFSAGREIPQTAPLYTMNRKPGFNLAVRPNERVRLRLVNGCQRLVVALKIADHDLNVVAIDSKPAEPFVARDGQIILAPGSRVDALLDAARPAGSAAAILLHDGRVPMPAGQITTNGAAVRAAPLQPPSPPAPPRSNIDLKGAQRVDLSLDPAQWVKASAFDVNSAPAFRTKRGRTVVLSITNTKASAATLHLHGQHVRLLDRLDDGWKPFWLDTLIFQPGQTQRIAFNAQTPGNRLLEAVTTAWSSPRLLRWYAVE